MQMNTTEVDVDALVRDVILHHGLPFTVLSVTESPAGWNIQVRAITGQRVSFVVPNGRSLAMRVAIQQRLEAEV